MVERSLRFEASTKPATAPGAELVVLPMAEGAKAPTPALSGPLRRHGVEGKMGQRLLMPGDPSTFVIGVGNADTASLSLASMYVGEAARPYASISISMPEGSSEASAARAITEGFLLGAYRFDHRKSDRESPRTRIVRIHGTDEIGRAHV